MARPVDLGHLLAAADEIRTSRPARPERGEPVRGDSWYRIQAAADGADTELWLYDEIGWYGISAQTMIDELKTVTTPTITLRVNSPGGDVFDGLAIYQALVGHPATVTTRVDGLAASAASLIAQAGETVHIAPQAMMMIHDAWGVCVGDAATMTATAALLDKISDAIADLYAQRAGGDQGHWRDLMRAETWYTGAEAVDAGLADTVITIGRRGARPDEDDEDDMTCRASRAHRAAGRPDPPIPPAMGGRPEPAPPGPRAMASPIHHTPVVDEPWNAAENTTRLDSPMPTATAHDVYAWYDQDRVEDGTIVKDACKLPHHAVDTDGNPGAAVANGVRNALARLPQSDIPEDDRDDVEAHLRAHLDDMDTDDADDAWTGLVAALTEPRDTFASLTEGLLT